MAELTTLEEKLAEVLGLARAPAILDKAQETKDEATDEAGEFGHWEWALSIQERHFAEVKEGSLKLAGEKDPYEES